MKKIKNKKKKILIIFFLILFIVFLGFFVNGFLKNREIEKNIKIENNIEREVEKILLKETENKEAYPLLLNRLKKEGVKRYFLSEMELIGDRYSIKIHDCLYSEGVPIYPKYIYETWSHLEYPDEDPKIGLVRYLVLPEDNKNFQPNRDCYVEEIKNEIGWDVIKKYNFHKDRFID